MTTVAHPQLSTNCPNMFGFVVVVVVALHWLETKWNEKTQLGQNMVHGVGGRVATQCNDERKIDMHVISRIRTSTRIADVDDVVCSAPPSLLPFYIPFTYINYAVYVSTTALPPRSNRVRVCV